jgi:hypothetical protein
MNAILSVQGLGVKCVEASNVKVCIVASVAIPTGRLGYIGPVLDRPPKVTVADIQRAVASLYRLTRDDLISDRRARAVARPRQVAMWLCKQLTARSLPDIGRRFGNRDHTTVLHAVRRIEALMAADPSIARDCAHLLATLGGRPA